MQFFLIVGSKRNQLEVYRKKIFNQTMKANQNLPKYSSITHEAIVETNKTLRFK